MLFVSFKRERRKFVTFTVELQRDGGPLGLTLATEGNADLPGPIYISSLQEDGLAHRTRLIWKMISNDLIKVVLLRQLLQALPVITE